MAPGGLGGNGSVTGMAPGGLGGNGSGWVWDGSTWWAGVWDGGTFWAAGMGRSMGRRHILGSRFSWRPNRMGRRGSMG